MQVCVVGTSLSPPYTYIYIFVVFVLILHLLKIIMYWQRPGNPAVQLRVHARAQQKNMWAPSRSLRLVCLPRRSTSAWARQRYRPSVRLCRRREIACRKNPGGCRSRAQNAYPALVSLSLVYPYWRQWLENTQCSAWDETRSRREEAAGLLCDRLEAVCIRESTRERVF